ncbi:hypothetical protein A4H97_04805 [Niastella yeongjuensis]|uniref:Heparan-alpha-glucosaminide N-acetyltransferase catalytic domain-containing protein n=1 Tax=Niastella yeongjuensis TaxID=354355 RepID=A0A1V9EL48_9BACT|nr:heparan-alpha-glucosaminide N-acetyltransferase domain-containing protein [Niastella yeongjuensis]OQP46846.1 hypothetical protein A4H97_04805 [Niastella yeongjuensis]SEN56941.1 Uncharacterized membrane protein [Niastella yeongjuensis]
MKRVYSIDVLRGIVMIIMTLDHVRDLLHTTSITQQPTDLNTTTPLLFFTRWITHLCAPTFVFLSGTSAFLSMKRTNDLQASRRFLLTRGLWLIVLEFTLVGFGVWFDIHFNVLFFNVIATIGIGFIVLALLLERSTKTIAIIGLCILLLHNLAPLVPGNENALFKKLLMPLFAPASYPLGNGRFFIIGYPPIPWLGIMLIGFVCGRFFELEIKKQQSLFIKMGFAAIGLFILLRFINLYGDPAPWSQQKNGLFTFLSFINVTKYPPSLQFCLLFLGVMFPVAAAIAGLQNKWTEIISVYGKVPLFYFVLHWYLIHPLVFVMVFMQGFKSTDMVFGFNFGRPIAGSGIPLWTVYIVWMAIVMAMYPLCKWYGRYKERNKGKLLPRYF